MKRGRISYQAYQRSVRKNLTHRDERLLTGYAAGWDCAVLQRREGCLAAAAVSAELHGLWELELQLYVLRLQNQLLAAGSCFCGMSAVLLLPKSLEEEDAARLVKLLDRITADCKAILLQVQVQTIAAGLPVVNLWGIGEDMKRPRRHLRAGDSLILAGNLAASGTILLCGHSRELLEKRYASGFLERTGSLQQAADLTKTISCLEEETAIYPLTDSVMAGLWYALDADRLGMDAELLKMPISQETVEICEFLRRNPYQLITDGAALIGTTQGEALLQRLQEKRIPAAIIGTVTPGPGRLLHLEEEIRYLDKPQQAEWEKYWEV